MVAGIALLFAEALRSWSLYRSQVEAVVASVGCILLLDVAFMAGYAPVRGLHMGLVVMSVGMLPVIWALPGLRAADYSAVWRRRVLEGMSDAVLMADGEGRIVSANRAAQALLTAGSGRERLGADLSDYPWLAESDTEVGPRTDERAGSGGGRRDDRGASRDDGVGPGERDGHRRSGAHRHAVGRRRLAPLRPAALEHLRTRRS